MARLNQQKAGVLLSYLNLLLGCIVPLFYTPVMMRILGQAEYGLYALSQSFTSYLSLLNLGMGTAIVRYIVKYRGEGNFDGLRRLLGLFITIYSCLALLVCVIGGGLALFADSWFSQGLTPGEISRMKILVAIMTVGVAVSLPLSAFASVVTAYEKFVFSKSLAIFGTIAAPVLNLVILFLGRGSVGMALMGLTVQIVTGVVTVTFCAKKLRVRPSFRSMPVGLLKEIAGYCFFVFLSTIADMLYWSTDKVLIGARIGAVAVAIYNVGGVFTSIMQNMAQTISQVFTPRIMMIARKKEQTSKEISEMLIRIGRIQFYIVAFILSGYGVFGQQFIRFWAGEGYEQAYFVALLTMVPLAVPLIQSIAYSTTVAQNKHRFRAIIYCCIAVMNVISTYLVLPYFGIIGAAVCTAVAFALGNGIILNIYYQKVIKLDILGFWKNIIRIAIVPILVAAGAWFVYNCLVPADSMVCFLLGIVIYSLLFWILNWFLSMNRYEKNLLLGLIKK